MTYTLYVPKIKYAYLNSVKYKYGNTKTENGFEENIKKALRTWKFMTPRERALAQPNGRRRAKPGSTGEGNYYRIEIREKSQFSSFRNHDVGEKGGIQRIVDTDQVEVGIHKHG